MSSNCINATLQQTDVDRILADIANLRQGLPFLIDLSLEERKGMPKLGDKLLPFVTKTLTVAEQHPEILPSTFALDNLRAAADMYQKLYPVRLALEHFLGQVLDTLCAAGSDARVEALHVYKYAQAANAVTGSLEDAVNELARFFAHHASPAPSPDAVTH